MLALYLTALGMANASPLQPTARWVVDFGQARCIASRSYGNETLALKASPLGDVVQLILLSPGGSVQAEQVQGVVQPAGGIAIPVTALRWRPPAKPPRRMTAINLPVADFAKLGTANSVRIQLGNWERELALSCMTRLSDVMKACVDDLQRFWGGETVTPAQSIGTLASYFTDGDYPDDAIRNALSGTTSFALLVDEQGKVADCMVTGSSGQALLDTQTCGTLSRRARFEPGRDKAGKPARDRVVGRIRWALP